MIQAIKRNNFDAWISTEENRINTSVPTTQIRFLVKFSNDLSGKVFYCYPQISNGNDIKNRYTEMEFIYALNPDMYVGEVELTPAGYYKYEVYEVSWGNPLPGGDTPISNRNAPVTEIDVLLPESGDNGIVQGLIDIGKLYLSEEVNKEEVSYIPNAKRVQTLNIHNSGSGYATAPTIVIESPPTGSGGHTATATCTILAGAVNTVTITYAGSGYTTNPGVVLSGGGFTLPASITADIYDHNYIYYV